jgi:hypothetical protein
LEPLVLQTIADYSHASLLLRLPGYIPIPSFDLDVVLPSSNWINEARTQFTPTIEAILNRPPSLANGRKIVDVPLIVRSPSKGCYTLPFRAALLSSMDVPISQHESKILLVSFGGQSIPRPKTRPPSPLHSPVISTIALPNGDAHYLAKPKVDAGMLPEGWIAIVCGLSGDKDEIRRNLPDGFYASDRNAHVPDLTALADVVLGKLVSTSNFHLTLLLTGSSAGIWDLLRSNFVPHTAHLRSVLPSHVPFSADENPNSAPTALH